MVSTTKLKSVDFFRKIPRDLTEASLSGAGLSIVAAFTMVFLFGMIHDEVILEGPMESAEVAKDIVVSCMAKPFNGKNILSVDLSVDAKCAQNWYAAK